MKKRTATRTLLLTLALSASVAAFAHAEEAETIVAESPPQLLQMEEQQPEAQPSEVAAQQPEASQPEEETPEEKPVFTVVFLADDDEVLFEEQLTLGDLVVAPFFVPTKDGCVFQFWYDVSSVEETEEIEEYRFNMRIAENVVLKPYYVEALVEEGEEAAAPADEERLMPWDIPQVEQNDDADAAQADDGLTIVIVDDPEAESASETEAVAAETVSQIANCSIKIFSSHAECVEEGATIDLWAELIGFEGMEVALQWQFEDQGEWHNAEGATKDTHSFIATKESINYGWRLIAEVLGSEGA